MMKSKVLFVSNQGGEPVVKLNSEIGFYLKKISQCEISFASLVENEKNYLKKEQQENDKFYSFEKFLNKEINIEDTLEYINKKFYNINWSEVIAAERIFTDYSYLENSTGQRKESAEYINILVCNMILFFDELVDKKVKPNLIICQTADTIFSNILFRIAQFYDVKIVAPSPAWLTGGLEEGGFLTTNVFYESEIFEKIYKQYDDYIFTVEDEKKVNAIIDYIKDFDGNKAFYKITKKNFGKSPISPNIKRIFSYILSEYKKDKYIYFTKVDILSKIKANILRFVRFQQLKFLLKKLDNKIPEKSIFFPLHFQPEQSTLVSGAYYTNQIALIENISRSLPLGYTLIVKEHPSGRGTRSLRQYKQILSFYNVKMVELPSKEIVKKCEVVITISGTIAMEALALNKPTIVFGKQFFSFGKDIFYHVDNIKNLFETLHKIIYQKDFENKNIVTLRKKFFLTYLNGLIPYFPKIENAEHYAQYILDYYNQENN